MNKLKIIGLCIASALLGGLLVFGIHSIKWESPGTSLAVTVSPAKAKKGDIVHLSAKVQNPSIWHKDTKYQWTILNEDGIVPHFAITDDHIIIPNGTNTKTLFYICDVVAYNNYILTSGLQPLTSMNRIPIDGVQPGPSPTPTPTPTPVPDPTPNPAPNKDPLNAVWIYDNSAAPLWSQDTLKLHNSTTVIESLKNQNITWRTYDITNAVVTTPAWKHWIQKTGVPGLFFLDKGDVLVNKIVDNEADVIKEANILRGVK